jgi:hypothetical protein
MISVKEIDIADRKQREVFLKIPFAASALYPNWIPGLQLIHRQLLDPAKNPFLKEVQHHFYIAEKAGQPVGRIALFGPGHWQGNTTIATIGFVDFTNNAAVWEVLFQQVEEKARSLGATKLIGPLNPNIHYDLGILSQGFELPNAAFLNYNPAYYTTAFEQQGWVAAKTFQSWKLEKDNFHPSGAFKRICDTVCSNPELTLRNINLSKFDEELALFYNLYCQSFSTHWGFTAPCYQEFKFIAGDLRYLLKEHMGMVAELKGVPVGFVLGIPDIYQLLQKDRSGRLFPFNWFRLLTRARTLSAMRIMIAGMLPAYHHTGIYAAMFNTFTSNVINKGGIQTGEIGWVMKGNSAMEKALSYMGAKPVKEYILYEKNL